MEYGTEKGTIWRQRAEEWVGRGPPSGDLGEKDCLWRDGRLPAWWLLLSSPPAYNGKAAPLAVWLEGTPHSSLISVSGFQPLTEDKSIWLLLKSGRVEYCLCVYCLSFLFFLFCLIDAFTLARLTEVFQRFICAASQVHVCARTHGHLGGICQYKSCFLFF